MGLPRHCGEGVSAGGAQVCAPPQSCAGRSRPGGRTAIEPGACAFTRVWNSGIRTPQRDRSGCGTDHPWCPWLERMSGRARTRSSSRPAEQIDEYAPKYPFRSPRKFTFPASPEGVLPVLRTGNGFRLHPTHVGTRQQGVTQASSDPTSVRGSVRRPRARLTPLRRRAAARSAQADPTSVRGSES